MPVNYGSLPFLEAIAFFRAKLNLPTQRWDDLLGAAHDRAFVVAGAIQADLLADLRAAVDKAIADGSDILAYLRQTAAENGIDRKIRYQRKVVSAAWSSEDA